MLKMRKKNYIINTICILLLFLGLTLFVKDDFTVGVIINICISIVIVSSLNIVVGCLGQLTLGHAGFVSIGAYVSAIITKNHLLLRIPALITGGKEAAQTLDMSNYGSGAIMAEFIIALIIAGLVAMLFGFIIGLPALRLTGDYLAIITLGFGEIIRVFIENLQITGGSKGLMGIPRILTLKSAFIIMVICVTCMYTFMTSRHGRAILSIREDEIAASSSGIDTTYYKTLAFTISAFFAGVGGAMYAHYNIVLKATQFNYNKSIEYLINVVFGGLGSFSGSIFATTLLETIRKVLQELFQGADKYRMLAYSVALIAMMIFRPSGIFGRHEISPTRLFDKLFGKNKKAKKEEKEMEVAVNE